MYIIERYGLYLVILRDREFDRFETLEQANECMDNIRKCI